MATFIDLSNRTYLAHLVMTGLANHVDFGPLSRVMQDSTTFADGGYSCVKPGLISGSAMIAGFQDYALGVLDDQISAGQLGTSYPISVVPNPTGTVTAGDTCWMSRGVLSKEQPLQATIGDMGKFQFDVSYDTAIVQAKVLAPIAAQTVTTTGTAVALPGPTASQKLYAAIHVTAYSGLTNAVFTVQTDTSAGFASPTTRITFSTVTGKTSEFLSVVGPFATATHCRILATLSGVGSITYVAVAGVI